jgi:hypothetical protein
VDLGDDDEKKKRLAGLAAFQTSIITHCLKCTSPFPTFHTRQT